MGCSDKVYLRISPAKFHTLKFILEGYDNLAVLSSEDMKNGIVLLRYPSDSAPALFSLLRSIAAGLKT